MSVFKGLDTLEALVELMKDPGALENTLKTIRDATDAYNVAIENVTELSKVDQYIQEVNQARVEIESKKVEANKRAESIMKDAAERAEGIRKKADEMSKEAQRLFAEASTVSTSLKEKEKDVILRLEGIKEKESTLKNKQAELEEAIKEYTEKKAKILAAVG